MDRNLIAVEAIKRLRKEKKISLQDLADLTHKSKSAWARKESGDVEITLNEAEEVAQVLGTDFSSLTNAGVVINNNNSGNFVSNGMNPSLNLQNSKFTFSKLSSCNSKYL